MNINFEFYLIIYQMKICMFESILKIIFNKKIIGISIGIENIYVVPSFEDNFFSFNKIVVNKVINNNNNNLYFPKVTKEHDITNSVFIKFINKQNEEMI